MGIFLLLFMPFRVESVVSERSMLVVHLFMPFRVESVLVYE